MGPYQMLEIVLKSSSARQAPYSLYFWFCLTIQFWACHPNPPWGSSVSPSTHQMTRYTGVRRSLLCDCDVERGLDPFYLVQWWCMLIHKKWGHHLFLSCLPLCLPGHGPIFQQGETQVSLSLKITCYSDLHYYNLLSQFHSFSQTLPPALFHSTHQNSNIKNWHLLWEPHNLNVSSLK